MSHFYFCLPWLLESCIPVIFICTPSHLFLLKYYCVVIQYHTNCNNSEDCNSKFIEMHVDASDIYPSALVFYTRQRDNITIYRTVYLHTDMCLQTITHIQLKNKLWTTVAFLRCCNLIWGLANNNYSLYFLQFLTISGNLHLCYIFIPYCTVLLYKVGPLSKLTEFDMILCHRNEKK
jgi:hypothetical protein